MGKFCEEFVGMLQSFDDLMGINDSPAPAIVQTGDLVFISETIEGSGFIAIVDEGDGKSTYQRVYIEGDTVKLCTMTHFSDIREVPRDAVKISGRVTGFYRKLEDTPLPADGLEDTPLYRAIAKAEPGNFWISMSEARTIVEKNSSRLIGCIWDAFRYGFIKGQRAAKAEAKREKKRLAERDTSGWCGYLSRWMARNIHNERCLGLVARFAKTLEGGTEKEAGQHGKETG